MRVLSACYQLGITGDVRTNTVWVGSRANNTLYAYDITNGNRQKQKDVDMGGISPGSGLLRDERGFFWVGFNKKINTVFHPKAIFDGVCSPDPHRCFIGSPEEMRTELTADGKEYSWSCAGKNGGSAAACSATSTATDRYAFSELPKNPKPYRITLYPNQDTVVFPVPKPALLSFDSGDGRSAYGREIHCLVVGSTYGSVAPNTPLLESPAHQTDLEEDHLTAVVEVSQHIEGHTTFHSRMSELLSTESVPREPDRNNRIDSIGAALFYTYFWGWYAGFINMPYFSIQGLLSSQPYVVTDKDGKSNLLDMTSETQDLLRRYRSLSSLFVDESDGRFESEHFGFLTPKEVQDKYKHYYADRFKAYFSRALGEFLQEIPTQYRQQ